MAKTATQNNVMNYQDFRNLISEWADELGVRPKEIHLRDMKNKWASLSGNGRLTFNSELLEMEKKYSDYVIVHELLHMKVPNHGRLFKSLMFSYLPDWEIIGREINMPIE